jgi:hypothetical protein
MAENASRILPVVRNRQRFRLKGQIHNNPILDFFEGTQPLSRSILKQSAGGENNTGKFIGN